MTEPLIQWENVDFAYEAARPVLCQCSFRLVAGQRLALCGPNGSGKTTVLHLTVGLLRPQAGKITVFGQDRVVESDFYDVRRRVGLLFQQSEDQLFCPTVLEDVAFGPLNLGLSREEVRRRVADTLESVGLAGYEHRITYKLSGGEKRLVALATILAMQPEVLLLDEPTEGLDEQSSQRLTELLAGLPQAMIIVSHHEEFRRQIANSFAVLENGRITVQ